MLSDQLNGEESTMAPSATALKHKELLEALWRDNPTSFAPGVIIRYWVPGDGSQRNAVDWQAESFPRASVNFEGDGVRFTDSHGSVVTLSYDDILIAHFDNTAGTGRVYLNIRI